MHGAPEFLTDLTLVLCVAAVTTVLFQRLHQPVVLGYILAGLIIGPHVPVPLVANQENVQTLSELGVILLMFSLGLEFSVRKFIQVAPTAGLTAVFQCSLMLWLGFMVGRLFGWTNTESFVAGAVIAISSTTIIAKAFDELRIGGSLRELVVGILIIEDLIGILLMAALTAVSAGSGLSAAALVITTGKLVAFLAGSIVFGLLLVPRVVRLINRLNRPETTLVSSVGICFAGALLAREFDYSVALGAFIAGSLIAESGEHARIQALIEPIRDMFAAIFFVSVGMLIDPASVAEHWLPVVVLTLVVVLGKVLSVTMGAFLTGHGVRTSVQAGLSLSQIGEFSFIIAGLAVSLGLAHSFLYPIAVSVSAITTLSTPWLIRWSPRIAEYADRKLPRPLQTSAALYASWLERIRSSPRSASEGAQVRRLVRLLLLDSALLAVIVIGTAQSMERLERLLGESLGLELEVVRLLAIGGAVLLSVPFLYGIFQIARKLGLALAASALPQPSSPRLDLAEAPRRVLVVSIQIAVVLLVCTPVLALTQPFVPGVPGALVLGLVVLVLAWAFWRSATNLLGHVRAGSQVIVAVLAKQTRETKPQPDENTLGEIEKLVPGLGLSTPYRVPASSPAVGCTLADLNLRGRTGATVLAILRGEEGVNLPTAKETLRAGDVLALAGSNPAVQAAKELLGAPRKPAPERGGG
jgi:K+:H+ antiporter